MMDGKMGFVAASCFAYVGSFTPEFTGIDGEPMGAAEGLSVFFLDGPTGAFEAVQVLAGMRSPSFVVAHPLVPAVYAVERELGPDQRDAGALNAFAIDASGQVSLSGRQPSGGKWPCRLGVHPSGRHLYVADIASGHLAAFPVDTEGRVGAQDATVAHLAVFETTPSGDLVPCGHAPTAGLFPRAVAITPDEHLLVAANQKPGTLVSFWLDAETGSLERTGHEIATPTPVSVAFVQVEAEHSR
jgi:6-phosphogluconolactonase (cycloisomerase 2 family)